MAIVDLDAIFEVDFFVEIRRQSTGMPNDNLGAILDRHQTNGFVARCEPTKEWDL